MRCEDTKERKGRDSRRDKMSKNGFMIAPIDFKVKTLDRVLLFPNTKNNIIILRDALNQSIAKLDEAIHVINQQTLYIQHLKDEQEEN